MAYIDTDALLKDIRNLIADLHDGDDYMERARILADQVTKLDQAMSSGDGPTPDDWAYGDRAPRADVDDD